MRGDRDEQLWALTPLTPESFVPEDHSVRALRRLGSKDARPLGLPARPAPFSFAVAAERHGRLLLALETGISGAIGLDVKTRVFMAEEMSQHRAGLYHPCYGLFGGGGGEGGGAGGFIGLTEPTGGSDPARGGSYARGTRR